MEGRFRAEEEVEAGKFLSLFIPNLSLFQSSS